MTDIYTKMEKKLDEKGSLSGKKVVIQPNMSMKNLPTEAGSKALEGFTALETATVINRFQKAGGTIAGSSRIAEFAFGLNEDTTASILTEKTVDCAFMTDTLGEASHTAQTAAMYGFKPTYGIVSRFGLIGLIPSMETFGIIAESTEIIVAIMKEICGLDNKDVSMSDNQIPDFSKIDLVNHGISTAGIPAGYSEMLDEKERKIFLESVENIKSAGIAVKEIPFPAYRMFQTVHFIIGCVEASSACGKYDSVRYGHRAKNGDNWNEMYINSRKESFRTLLKTYLFQGAYFQFENYESFEKAAKVRTYLAKETAQLFEKVDVIISPVKRAKYNTGTTKTIDAIYNAFALTLPANVLGCPTLSLPITGKSSEQNPGLQIMGKPYSDVALLSWAATIL
ncbi:MAG: amidase family protein [Candidatus Theseobacter exili]|nr:amidase family protein [Candidatus Theseobacter exili]